MQIYERAMERAIGEASLYKGATSPNPPVGAVGLDEEGRFLSVAAHKRAGDMHAEIALLTNPLLRKKIHTLLVTLEPCSHYGKTPPCVEAIVEAGVKRVVIGCLDPNPRVQGRGVAFLKKAGVEVETGVLERSCKELIQSFQKYISTGIPWVVVKRAFWGEKKTMIPPPNKKTFSSEKALRYAHERRKIADAIFTASGTVLADDPLFTVRHVKDWEKKKRFLVLFDRRKRVPSAWCERAKSLGFELVTAMGVWEAMEFLGKKGVMEVLVEAGPSFSNFILEKEWWDEEIEILVQEKEEKIIHRLREF